MRVVSALRLWLRALFGRAAVEREIDKELAFHLDCETELNIARGMSAGEARRAALLAFGGLDQTREALRDERQTAWLEQTAGDVRLTLRSLRNRPAFTLVATLTVALAIGATTAIYSIVDSVLFRGVASRGVGRLVAVWETVPEWRTQPVLASSWDHVVVDYTDFRAWRARQASFVAVGAMQTVGATLWTGGHPESVGVGRVSPSCFTVLGTVPAAGRLLLPGEDVIDGPKVTVLSFDTWQTRFGGRGDVVGRTVLLDSMPYRVVGVLPKDFSVARGVPARAFYLPAGQTPDDQQRGNHSYRVIGRLKPGVTIEQAETEARQLLSADTERPPRGVRVADLQIDQTRTVRQPLLLLLAASALLVLIATLNMATLLLGEAATREREMSARVALGATRQRLVRQMLTESTVLAAIGALAGVALAWGMVKALIALAPPNVPGILLARLDGRVLAATTLVTVAAGLLFGLAPALSLSAAPPSDLLRGSRTVSAHRPRLANTLMALQVALSVVLLLSAALVSRSLGALSRVDTGFDGTHIAVVSTDYPFTAFKTEALRRARADAIVARIAALPGVQAVSGSSVLPFSGRMATNTIALPGDAALGARAPKREVNRRIILPNFFATLGIPVLAGRSFDATDRDGAARAMIVSDALARREWPHESALGKQVQFYGASWTVVGVVVDTKMSKLTDDAEPTVYVPMAQLYGDLELVVRTAGDPDAAAPLIRAAVADASPLSQVLSIRSMLDLVRTSMAEERFRTTLIDLFGALAMLLAGIGLYGLTARLVARRMREAGIRIALGATVGSVARLLAGRVLLLVAVGLAAGLLFAAPAVHVLKPYLFGVTERDRGAYIVTIALLAAVATAASLLPTSRLRRMSLTGVLTMD